MYELCVQYPPYLPPPIDSRNFDSSEKRESIDQFQCATWNLVGRYNSIKPSWAEQNDEAWEWDGCFRLAMCRLGCGLIFEFGIWWAHYWITKIIFNGNYLNKSGGGCCTARTNARCNSIVFLINWINHFREEAVVLCRLSWSEREASVDGAAFVNELWKVLCSSKWCFRDWFPLRGIVARVRRRGLQ